MTDRRERFTDFIGDRSQKRLFDMPAVLVLPLILRILPRQLQSLESLLQTTGCRVEVSGVHSRIG